MITDNFFIALKIAAVGMAGIFIFMMLFWAIIIVLHKKFPGESSSIN